MPFPDRLPIQLHAVLANSERPPLSNDVDVSDPGESNGSTGLPEDARGVLENLPRTRPQRSSPRRAAARVAAAASEPDAGSPPAKRPPAAKRRRSTTTKGSSATASRPAKPARKPAGKARPAGSSEAVPRQGYETEGERVTGSVQPPGTPELIATAAEALAEVAKVGLSGGERLLKDLLARLPGT